jgi:DNA mismatch repair protein MutL
MPKIKYLPEETIKKIAAGEVIARPLSVVKELIENSLDAAAKKITVELKAGGKDLIKVIDDGEGMSRDDIRLAIARHTTSKIASIEDLTKIRTYGFRGEALASIAAVSRMRIESNNDERSAGTYLFVEAGEIKEIKEIARMRGTTIVVETLFFNLPVRRSFLKSPNYELKLIIEAVIAYALAYPECHFELLNDQKEIFSLPKVNSYKDRLSVFLEKKTYQNMVEFHYTNPLLNFYGVIELPEATKNYFELQQIFFNLRPVKSKVVTKAIYDGYSGTLMGKNPNFVVFIETDPENLDINIHPTKAEVRFIDERFLYDFVTEAIRKTLGLKKQKELPQEEFLYQQSLSSEESTKSFWQLHNSYIFAQIPSGYCIIDQHAASERILFEEILRKDEPVNTQGLLFPMIIELSPEEYAVYEEIKDLLSGMGLETKSFSGRSIVIESIPANSTFSRQDLKELFREFVRLEKKLLTHKEELARRIACHGAIKANHRLSQAEIENLINKLFSSQDPYFCPHGRPTIIKISREELDRKFGR